MSNPKIPFKPTNFDMAMRAVDEMSTERRVPSHVVAVPAGAGERAPAPAPAAVVAPVAPILAAPPAPRALIAKLSVELPQYLIDAIHARTLQSKPKATNRYIILQALKAIGFEIKPEDMVIDGRKNAHV